MTRPASCTCRTQRLIGFAACFGLGLLLTFLVSQRGWYPGKQFCACKTQTAGHGLFAVTTADGCTVDSPQHVQTALNNVETFLAYPSAVAYVPAAANQVCRWAVRSRQPHPPVALSAWNDRGCTEGCDWWRCEAALSGRTETACCAAPPCSHLLAREHPQHIRVSRAGASWWGFRQRSARF